MAKKALVDVINGTLGKYIHDLNAQSLSLSLWSGNIELTQGFTLNVEAINSHELMQHQPFLLERGHVGFIGIHVPWASLASKSVNIKVSNVELVVKPKDISSVSKKDNDDAADDKAQNQRLSEDELKKQRREKIEREDKLRKQQDEFLKQFFGNTLAKEDLFSSDINAATGQVIKPPTKQVQEAISKAAPEKEGFAARLVRRIVENISFDLTDVHIQFVSSSVTSSTSFSFGMVMDELSVFTTNANGERVFMDRTPVSTLTTTVLQQPEFLYKRLKIKGWGIYLEEGLGVPSVPLHSTTVDSPTLSVLGSTKIQRSFLIKPLDFQTSLRQLEYAPPGLDGGPPSKYKCEAVLPQLSLQLSRSQLVLTNVMVSTLTQTTSTTTNDDNEDGMPNEPLFPKLRPLKSPKEAPREWWTYAFRSIHMIQNGYPYLRSQLWKQFYISYQKRKNYVQLYKRYAYSNQLQEWYKPLTAQEERTLKQMEMDTDTTVEGIVKWRTMADAQVKYEQEQYRQSQQNSLVENVVNLIPGVNIGGNGDGSSDDSSSERSPLGVHEWKLLDSVLETQEKQLQKSSQLVEQNDGAMHQTSAVMIESRFVMNVLTIELFNTKSETNKTKKTIAKEEEDDFKDAQEDAQNDEEHRIAKFDCTGVETSYLLTFGGDVTMIASVSNLVMTDDVTGPNTLFPHVLRTIPKTKANTSTKEEDSDTTSLFYMEYEKLIKHTNVEQPDTPSLIVNSIKMRSLGLECLLSPVLMTELTQLFATPTTTVDPQSRDQLPTVQHGAMLYTGGNKSGVAKSESPPDVFYDAKDEVVASRGKRRSSSASSTSSDIGMIDPTYTSALYEYASTKASSAADSAMTKLVDKWQKSQQSQIKQTWRIDMEAEAPLVVIPESCIHPNATVFVLDLGHFSLTSKEDTSSNLKTWFKSQNKNKADVLEHVESYHMNVSHMVLLMGTAGNRDWYTKASSHGATDEHDFENSSPSKAVMDPISFHLDVGVLDLPVAEDDEEEEVATRSKKNSTTICVDGTLEKLKLCISPQTMSRAMDVAQAWTKVMGGSNEPSKQPTLTKSPPTPPALRHSSIRASSISSTGSRNQRRSSSLATSGLRRSSIRESTSNKKKITASMIFTERHSNEKEEDRVMMNATLRMAGFAIEVLSSENDDIKTTLSDSIEARLASVEFRASVLESGKMIGGVSMGCFAIASRNSNATSSVVLLHTNLYENVTSFDTISNQSSKDVMKTLEYMEQKGIASVSDRTKKQHIVPALDLQIVLPSSAVVSQEDDGDDAPIKEPIQVTMTFSGLVVHWRVDAIENILQLQSKYLTLLSSSAMLPEPSSNNDDESNHGQDYFVSARDMGDEATAAPAPPRSSLLLPNIQEEEGDENEDGEAPPNTSASSSSIQATIQLTSVGLLLYDRTEKDTILYYMTMSQTQLSYKSTKDTMKAVAQIGDLTIGETSNELSTCRPEYRCVLGMSSESDQSLFEATFEKGNHLTHPLRPNATFDVIATAHLSPMKCVVLNRQLLGFMTYLNNDILATLDTASTSTTVQTDNDNNETPTNDLSSPSEEQEVTATTESFLGTSQLFVAEASGFEVIVPESSESINTITAGISLLQASYEMTQSSNSNAKLHMKGLTAKCGQDNAPLIPEDIVLDISVNLPSSEDEPIDANISLSKARIYLSKTQYAQIMKTLSCNLGDSPTATAPSSSSTTTMKQQQVGSNTPTEGSKEGNKNTAAAAAESSTEEDKPLSAAIPKVNCRFVAEGMEVHLCHEAMINEIVCMNVQNLIFVAQTNHETGMTAFSNISLQHVEIKDVRSDSQRKDTHYGYLLKHTTSASSDSAKEALFDVKGTLSDKGDVDINVSLSGMNIVYIPDLVSDILGFTALADAVATTDEDDDEQTKEETTTVTDITRRTSTSALQDDDSNNAQSASSLIQSVKVTFVSRRVRALLVNVDEMNYPIKLQKTTFVFEGDIETSLEATLSSKDMSLQKVTGDLKGNDFEIYTESHEQDTSPIQVTSPTNLFVSLKYHGGVDTTDTLGDATAVPNSTINVSMVVLTPIDVSISTKDMALMYRILASISAADEARQTTQRRAQFAASRSSRNQQTASKVQLLMDALEGDESSSTTSSVSEGEEDDGTIGTTTTSGTTMTRRSTGTMMQSTTEDGTMESSLHDGCTFLSQRPYMTVSVTVTVQQVGVQIINDIHGLDHALLRVMANECTSGGELRFYQKTKQLEDLTSSSSLMSSFNESAVKADVGSEVCYDFELGCSLESDYYYEGSWQPLLTRPWQVTLGASRSPMTSNNDVRRGAQSCDRRMATSVYVHSTECRLSVMETFLVNLGQAQLCFEDAKTFVERTTTKTGSGVILDTIEDEKSSFSSSDQHVESEQIHPFCICNTSGYDLALEGERVVVSTSPSDETCTIKNGTKCYFDFQTPKGKGVGHKRLYGEEAPSKQISLKFENHAITLDLDDESYRQHAAKTKENDEPTWHQLSSNLVICTHIQFNVVTEIYVRSVLNVQNFVRCPLSVSTAANTVVPLVPYKSCVGPISAQAVDTYSKTRPALTKLTNGSFCGIPNLSKSFLRADESLSLTFYADSGTTGGSNNGGGGVVTIPPVARMREVSSPTTTSTSKTKTTSDKRDSSALQNTYYDRSTIELQQANDDDENSSICVDVVVMGTFATGGNFLIDLNVLIMPRLILTNTLPIPMTLGTPCVHAYVDINKGEYNQESKTGYYLHHMESYQELQVVQGGTDEFRFAVTTHADTVHNVSLGWSRKNKNKDDLISIPIGSRLKEPIRCHIPAKTQNAIGCDIYLEEMTLTDKHLIDEHSIHSPLLTEDSPYSGENCVMTPQVMQLCIPNAGVLVTYSQDIACGLVKEDNDPALVERDSLNFPSNMDGLPLCAFTTSSGNQGGPDKRSFVFLPHKEYHYRIVSDDFDKNDESSSTNKKPTKVKKITKSFQLDDLSIGTGAGSTPIEWEDGTSSGLFAYTKLSGTTKEIHVIPEYMVYNGSDLHLVVKSGMHSIHLAPNEAKPLKKKDDVDGMVMDIDIDETTSRGNFTASAGPIQVSSVGFRLCPIVAAAGDGQTTSEVVGSLAIQTTTGNHESHLIVKIGSINVDESTTTSRHKGDAESSLTFFSMEDALKMEMTSSVFQAVLLDSSKTPMLSDVDLLHASTRSSLSSSSSRTLLPGKAIVSLEVGGMQMNLERQHLKMIMNEAKQEQRQSRKRTGSNKVSSSIASALSMSNKKKIVPSVQTTEQSDQTQKVTEWTMIHLKLKHVAIQDCVTLASKSSTRSTTGSSSSISSSSMIKPMLTNAPSEGNFCDLNITIKGPLKNDVVHVTLFQCDLFTSGNKTNNNGSLVIDTSEEFLWAVFDVIGRINRAISSFGGTGASSSSSSNNDGGSATGASRPLLLENERDTYSPPKSDIICTFSRVAISSFLLRITFKRRPDASRYPDVTDVPAASLINYSLKQLKFSLKNAQLYFAPYEAKNIRGPPDSLMDVVSAVYVARIKFKFLKIITAVRVEDWASLSGRNDEEDQFVAGDLSRSLGMIAGHTVGGAFKFAGSAVGGTIESATTKVGLGFLGRGANRVLSVTGNGANTVFVGAGKGAGQVLGGVEGGLNAARRGLLSGFQSGDAVAAVGGVSEGVATAGRGVADGVTSVSGACFLALKGCWMATPCRTWLQMLRSNVNRKCFQSNHCYWRWFIFVLVVQLISLSNVTMWLTFHHTNFIVPVSSSNHDHHQDNSSPSSIMSSYYYINDGTGGATTADDGHKGGQGSSFTKEPASSALAFTWLILYAPGTWLCWKEHLKRGSRRCLIWGSILTVVGAAIRYASFGGGGGSSRSGDDVVVAVYEMRFFGVEAGQAIAAFGQPFLLNCIGRISADWFGTIGREIACTFSLTIGLIGVFLGPILSELFVAHSDGDAAGAVRFKTIAAINFVVALVGLIFCYLFAESEPFEPPSNSTRQRSTAQLRLLTNEQRTTTTTSSSTTYSSDGSSDPTTEVTPLAPLPELSEMQTIVLQLKRILKDLNVWRIAITLGMGPIMVITFLVQTLRNFSIGNDADEDDDKTVVTVTNAYLCAISGAMIGGVISLVFQGLKMNGIGFKVMSVANAIVAFIIIQPFQSLPQCPSGVLFGFGGCLLASMLSLSISILLDLTYPINEVVPVGVLISITYLCFGAPTAILWAYTADQLRMGIRFSRIILFLFAVVGALFSFGTNGLRKRSSFDRQRRGSEEEPLLAMQRSRSDDDDIV